MADGPIMIDAEMAAFVRGPVSAFLGTADAMGTPDATRVVGLAPIGGDRLRVLISERAITARRNARPGAKIAVIVTNITSYRSIQWKGTVESGEETRSPGDAALIDHHVRAFRDASSVVGLDPDDVWRMFPRDAVPLVVAVEATFDQTPGARAGIRIGPAT
jgi:hypothetical protein